MAAKPNPALGLVLGIIAGYAAVVGASYAGARLQIARQVTFDSVVRHGLQWLVLLLLIAVNSGTWALVAYAVISTVKAITGKRGESVEETPEP